MHSIIAVRASLDYLPTPSVRSTASSLLGSIDNIQHIAKACARSIFRVDRIICDRLPCCLRFQQRPTLGVCTELMHSIIAVRASLDYLPAPCGRSTTPSFHVDCIICDRLRRPCWFLLLPICVYYGISRRHPQDHSSRPYYA
jgi:hypothetical protein